MYPDYIESLLRILKSNNIHTAIETSGYFEYETFSRKILPYLDLIYYDIKIADTETHAKITGKSNQKILDNFKRLTKEDIEVHPRTPLIPDITATHSNLSAIVGFLKDTGAENISLLPYNPMGFEMYTNMGREKPPLPERFMKSEEEKEIFEMLIEITRKINVIKGGHEYENSSEDYNRRIGGAYPRCNESVGYRCQSTFR